MLDTPKGLRKHIAIMGRRNAGKSTLLNAICGQEAAIVSARPGTTTDPVEKTMEIEGQGPVVLLDTAGIDDLGDLGELRVKRSKSILQRVDCAILVVDGDTWGEWEADLAGQMREMSLPFIIARNKCDLSPLMPATDWLKTANLPQTTPLVDLSAQKAQGVEELVALLADLGTENENISLLKGLVPSGSLVLFVAPIDSGAPIGRLILPQVQAIRDCLDNDLLALTVTPLTLHTALKSLVQPPALVVCDSQVVKKVAEIVPDSIPLTTFSILMARIKGNLNAFAKGAAVLKKIKPGDKILIQEACSHHAGDEDIGRVKIPALLRSLAGGELEIEYAAGKEMRAYDKELRLIVHCGACVITRKQMLVRQKNALNEDIAMTNYGMAISFMQGVLPRALKIFPEALVIFNES